MAVYKIQKNKAYFKRYQVKFRRRREAKTDYYQRKRLIFQAKDKYATRKYRLVVRSTNTKIICQITYATIQGDVIVCQANSMELPAFGITVGLNNYAAAYATGLLVARRVLAKFGLDKMHKGAYDPKTAGDDIHNEDEVEGRRPFKAVLDIGLARSTTGAKIFGAMKGVLDGGVNVPHDSKRFVGNDKESKEYKPEVHREHIFGLHVAAYMKKLSEENQTRYQRQFSQFIKNGITHDKIENMYRNAHEKIREQPITVKKPCKPHELKKQLTPKEARKIALKKISDRRVRVAIKKKAILDKIGVKE